MKVRVKNIWFVHENIIYIYVFIYNKLLSETFKVLRNISENVRNLRKFSALVLFWSRIIYEQLRRNCNLNKFLFFKLLKITLYDDNFIIYYILFSF